MIELKWRKKFSMSIDVVDVCKIIIIICIFFHSFILQKDNNDYLQVGTQLYLPSSWLQVADDERMNVKNKWINYDDDDQM